MGKVDDIRRRGAREVSPHNAEPNSTEVLPFGRYGGGLLTGHPIGLIIVIGLLVMGLVGIPEARWFFGGSLVLGGIVGLLLWLGHRSLAARMRASDKTLTLIRQNPESCQK